MKLLIAALVVALVVPAEAKTGLTREERERFDKEWQARLANCDTHERDLNIVTLDCGSDRVQVDIEAGRVLRLESRTSRLATFIKWALPIILSIAGGGAACANDRC